MPRTETAHLITYLFGDDEGAAMARRIDRRIDRLPGLVGLALVDNARRDATAGSATAGAPTDAVPHVDIGSTAADDLQSAA
jgi:hypothetical protein